MPGSCSCKPQHPAGAEHGDEPRTNITITENQRAVLQAAAHSSNLIAWPVPPKLGLSKGSATIVVKGLLKKGLLEEQPALGSDPIWREGEDGRRLTVIITRAGMAAIGLLPDSEPEQEPDGGDSSEPDRPRMPRPGSKLAILVELLSREEGATVEEMVTATGWQAHTVRGVMSEALVKKFGLKIESEKIESRGWVYRTPGRASHSSS